MAAFADKTTKKIKSSMLLLLYRMRWVWGSASRWVDGSVGFHVLVQLLGHVCSRSNNLINLRDQGPKERRCTEKEENTEHLQQTSISVPPAMCCCNQRLSRLMGLS